MLAPACTDEPTFKYADPCAIRPQISGGIAEMGFGTLDDITLFTPAIDGADFTVQPGVQYLMIGVLNVRTRDMTLGTGDRGGQVEFAGYDSSGQMVSLDDGCRVRDFAATDDGYVQLTSPFALPFTGAAASALNNYTITVHVDVRDPEGRWAWDERTFVFRR